jgi:uncharacterized protein with GYD domain
MATYVSLIGFTDQGIRNVKDTVQRAAAAKELATRMGGEMKALYWTLGGYDIVVISEFPDDETGTAYLLAIGSEGNIRTTTMRAFGEDEIQGILAKVG